VTHTEPRNFHNEPALFVKKISLFNEAASAKRLPCGYETYFFILREICCHDLWALLIDGFALNDWIFEKKHLESFVITVTQ
jgi:hypothetical protein